MKKFWALLFFIASFISIDGFENKISENRLNQNWTEKELDDFIHSMTLQDKIGQVFISLIYGDALDEKAQKFIDKTHVGNFLYFAWSNKLQSFSQVKKLSSEIKSCVLEKTGILPIIAIDQEGGKVSRLGINFNSLSDGFTVFPGNREVAKKAPSYAYDMGRTIGQEMKKAGLNLDFAPVVDVCPDENYFLSPRSYGKDPKTVALYAKEMIKGLHEGGVLSTIKHFPGHGDAKINSHFGLAKVDKPLAEALKTDLLPFILLKDETDCIMTGHIVFSCLDQTCASLSNKVLTDFLRNEINFKGVIISDSLAMRGVTPNQATFDEAVESLSKTAIKVFLAGCDCMIVSKLEWADFKTTQDQDYEIIERVLKSFRSEVEEGGISLNRLDESVRRILKLKLKVLKIQSDL